MVLIRHAAVFLCLLLLALPALDASAHENHLKERAARAEKSRTAATPGAMHERTEEHLEAMAADRPKSFGERVSSWVGRTHPFAVHFPIALFPVAWIALILARRRGEAVEIIRALVIVAGAASVVAALLGWFTGDFAFADPDATHLWHRWIGTGLGAAGGALALWAWRRRSAIDGRFMVLALGTITAVLLVQGWLGAALVHGAGHMAF